MFRNVMKKTSSLLGATVELADAAIFGAVAAGYVPKFLFKPTVTTIGAARFTKMFGETDPVKKDFAAIGYIPGALALGAGWFAEGSSAAGIFTVAIIGGAVVFAGEMAYKRYQNGKLEREDIVEISMTSAKTAGMIVALTFQGVGKVFALIEEGEKITWAHQIASGVASALSGFKAIKGYGMFGKSFCEESKPDKSDYVPLDDIHVDEGRTKGMSS